MKTTNMRKNAEQKRSEKYRKTKKRNIISVEKSSNVNNDYQWIGWTGKLNVVFKFLCIKDNLQSFVQYRACGAFFLQKRCNFF